MMNVINSNCCGCTGCVYSCPVNCITMIQNPDGFYVAEKDFTRCIHCGLCETVCPMNRSERPVSGSKPVAYTGWIKNEKLLYASTSGGVFSAVSDYVLSNNGVIFGSVFDESDTCVRVTSTETSIKEMRGSKYVQSDVGSSFPEIMEYLSNGRLVLFCGTPCQASSLRTYIHKTLKNIENLIILDFICHGVPSPLLLKANIRTVEKMHTDKIRRVIFRSKTHGWAYGVIEYQGEKKLYSIPVAIDGYMRLFCNNISLNTSCYRCPFTNQHDSDLIIGDYWGNKECAKINNMGTSLIIANTDVGKKTVEHIADMMILQELPKENYAYAFSEMSTSQKKAESKEFYSVLREKGFESACSKYLSPPDKKSVFINTAKMELRRLQYLFKSINGREERL